MDLIGCKVTIMQNRNTNLNDIYMSDRLQAQLQQIDQYAMTCVVAPMGYGKTTAVNWFLGGTQQSTRYTGGSHQHLLRQSGNLLAECTVSLCTCGP